MFSKVLIANRGEIAVRILRACKEMGIATVTVFSEADRDALHVSLADESYCIGGPQVKDSYLNVSAILSACVVSGAQALHPGYGLLSENAHFAGLCEQCGVTFIGPQASVIDAMGDKAQARRTMAAADVPIVPGCDAAQEASQALDQAREIGYPLLIKAAAGGGGRGIRLVVREEDFETAYRMAAAEAQSAFGDGRVYLERYLSPVKHVEVQLLCDDAGTVLCLGERDCSVQRRNQKLLEESPSPAVSPDLRRQLFATAEKAARAVGYRGAGTVEFLLDPQSGDFYFLEMNTRLQVEHPVSEMVTGIDLVKWQIRVAAGIHLPFSQQDIVLTGHGMECRINAENPLENYRPNCGVITLLHIPGGPWVRFDTALYQGYFVPPYYDSLIGKLIVHAPTREEAVRKMQAALSELVVEGIEHNAELQQDILAEPDFENGTYCTDLLARRG